ncbi:MAG TPA: hypothetical protein VM219_10300 [Phycisphaerae bacterium]|nr:hypothetical protein [Phycisphaerae bacterium]
MADSLPDKKPTTVDKGGASAGRGGFLAWLARAKRFRQAFPKPLRRLVLRLIPRENFQRELWDIDDQYADAEEVSTYPPKVDVTLGIVKEFAHAHRWYVGACRDLGVPYKLLDISGPDWINVIQNSGCDAFLVRPSAHLTIWKQMYDERLRVMAQELGKIIYPTYEELWIYESKRRMHYWLEANKVPHPRTWVFYDRLQALDFCRTVELPIVFKADLGAGASGVKIFRNRLALRRFVNRCFKKGMVRCDGDPRDRQWGCVLLQEYLADAAEWRMVRIGDSYFGYEKGKLGDFHSGSHIRVWRDPPERLLNFTRNVTRLGGFTSMALDIFEVGGRDYLVNELQAMFGTSIDVQMRVGGKPGRYVCDDETVTWHFEEGDFSRNGCCDLRVRALLKTLGYTVGVQAGS